MKYLPVFALLVIAASLCALAAEDLRDGRSLGAGGPTFVVLTKGIVGGIVPPLISERILIREVISEDGVATYRIWKMRQDTREGPRFFKGNLSKNNFGALVNEIENLGIWYLPTEEPEGSEDIYRMDTSVHVSIGKRNWRNGAPGGCIHGESEVQASGDQKDRFGKILYQIRQAANRFANHEIDEEEFTVELEMMWRIEEGRRQ
ncbi:MAG: hypothetical protein GY719_14695 [bacterium]|nr:hypothetical protein [bacterium]